MLTRTISLILLFISIPFFLGIDGCSSGGENTAISGDNNGVSTDPNNPTANTSKKVLARNIVLGTNLIKSAVLSTAQAQETGIDTTSKVLAENVVVDKSDNVLSSDNLQDALDKELAGNAEHLIKGTWVCKDVNGTQTGTVTLDGTNYSVDSGYCMNWGKEIPNVACHTPFTYKIIENSFLSISGNTSAEDCGNKNAAVTSTLVLSIMRRSTNKIVFWSGGSGVYFFTK